MPPARYPNGRSMEKTREPLGRHLAEMGRFRVADSDFTYPRTIRTPDRSSTRRCALA